MQTFTVTNPGPAPMRFAWPGSAPVIIPVGGTAEISVDLPQWVRITDANVPQCGGGPGEPPK